MANTTPAGQLFEMFGSASRLATAAGLNRQVVYKWNKPRPEGNDGEIPTRYNLVIVEAAERIGLDMDKVEKLLEPHTCPACDRPLEPEQTIRNIPGIKLLRRARRTLKRSA